MKGSLMQGKSVSRQRKWCQPSWCSLLTCNLQEMLHMYIWKGRKKILSLRGQNLKWHFPFTILFLLETFRRTGKMVSEERWTIDLVRGAVIVTDDWYCMPAKAKGLIIPILPSLAGNEISEQRLSSKASWPVKAGNNQRRMEPFSGWRWSTSLGVVQ